MVKGELTNENTFVYHISKISKTWKLENPYFTSLKDVLLNNKATKLNNLRKQQEYHFIAKLINDELNNNRKEINKNCKDILSLIKKYSKTKQQKTGDIIIRDLFFILVLKLLGRTKHFDSLARNKIEEFIPTYKTQESNFSNFHKVLALYYLTKISEQKNEVIKDNLDLAVNILYYRLLLTNNISRKKDNLLEYYLKQNIAEKIDLTASSESSKGRLLEIALILKSATGKGLYLPEIEKEQYLSSFTESIFREKYSTILRELTNLNFLKIKLPIWLTIMLFFLIEALIFILPGWVESISIFSFSIPIIKLIELPIWIILIVNGLIISLFLYIIQIHINKKISEEKWK